VNRERPKPKPNTKQQQTLASMGMAGWVRWRETPYTRPCGLGRGIHAADTPATGPTPPSTDSAICRTRGRIPDSVFNSISDRKIVSTKVDTYQHQQRQPLPTAAGICRGWGGVGWQDRWRHGWRHRAPWMGLRRVLPTHTAPPSKQKTRAALAFDVAPVRSRCRAASPA